jgi:hypothetical protein
MNFKMKLTCLFDSLYSSFVGLIFSKTLDFILKFIFYDIFSL